ncbi:DUF4232 domain-containing protein [Microbacterium terrisoli]|uniref:DUF4232 domain-containing protein n=1 Tax=Microbacterium terrisoli TaxID=3242192 RepID=UPI002804A99B|nr:DUF4232 domain-containing protein [Microbacterium protaetiae]
MPRRLIAGIVLAALWLASGWLPYGLTTIGGSASTLARLVPSPMRGGFFSAPLGWAVVLYVTAMLLIVVAYAAISSWFARGGRVPFAPGWLAAILTGFVLGAVLDLGNLIAWTARMGIGGAIGTMGTAALTVFWALVVGWIPALVVALGVRRRAESAVTTPNAAAFDESLPAAGALETSGIAGPDRTPTAAAPASTSARTTSVLIVSALAVVAAVALPLVDQGAHAATQAQLRQQQATSQAEASANADPGGAAPRDPNAVGDPVPTVATSTTPLPADACTPENSTLLAPGSDAATGHRLQTLQLVNNTDSACTVTGYPDVAFADQNGHLLPVTVEHGSSFMATDPGPSTITVKPGESVHAGIGWDANSMQGQLAARTLWAAPQPGATRVSWPVVLDIVAGTTVHVTAWETRAPAAG